MSRNRERNTETERCGGRWRGNGRGNERALKIETERERDQVCDEVGRNFVHLKFESSWLCFNSKKS